MTTVVYVVSTLELSGPTNQLYNIIKNLDRTNFYPIVITLSPEPLNSLKKKFEQINTTVVSLNLNRIKSLLIAKRRIKKILDKHRPDIIHTNGLRADKLLLKYNKFKCISTVRGDYSINYPSRYGKIGFLMAKLHINTIRKVNFPVACSESVANDFKEKYNIKLSSIPNGVDIEQFFPVKNKQKLRESLHLPGDRKIFITTGSIDFRKNIMTIINSFIYNADNINSILLIIGEGPETKKLKLKVNNNPGVIFLGKVINVHDYLKTSDYFISASLSEGLPNAVLEALACGLPVLLSDIPPHREIIELDKKVGLLFDKTDYIDLSHKINDLISKEYNSISIAAVNLIRKHFTAEEMSKKYQQLYYSLVNY